MKQAILMITVIAGLFIMPACRDREDNDGKTTILQDSMKTVLPTWQALNVVVSEDRTQMNVVVGDVTFYNAPAAEKNQKAIELGQMILRIYGKDSYLEKGNLIVTKDVRNKSEAPKDGISTPINFEELKKTAK